MADNVLRTVPGSGELIAADEVTDSELGTCKVQYVKLMSGTLDDTDKIASTGGAMNVNVVAGENVIHEYQNGDSPSSAYGSLMMGTDGNAIVPLKTTNEGEIVGSFEIANPSIAIEDGASASGVEGILVAGKDSSSNAQFLATDSDGHLQVDVVSGGGSSTGAIVDGESSSIKATVLDYTNSNPLAVRLTDTNGNYVTAGGGTEYTEGDTDTTITGTAVMFEADTSTSTLRAVSNTYPLPVSDAGGSLTVDGSISASQSGTWNIGTVTSVTNVVHVDDNSSSLTVDDGGGSLTVDGSVTVTQSTASNLNCTEASASSIKTAVELIDDGIYTSGSGTPSKGMLALGSDGTNPRALKTDTSGELQVDVLSVPTTNVAQSGTWSVRNQDGSGNTISSHSGALDVYITGGSSSGTQYTEGETDTTITGTAIMFESNTTNSTLNAVSSSYPLPVTVVGGGASDGAIVDGVSSSIKATVLDYTNSKPLAVRLTDTSGNYVTAGGGTQYSDGASRGSATGTLAMGDDGTNIQSLRCDTNGVLAIQDNNSTISVDDGSGSLTVDGSVTVTQSTASNLNCTEASASSIKTAVELIDDAVYADGASWSDGSSKGILAHGLYQSTPQTVSSGTVAPLQVDSNGKLLIGGTSIAGSAGSPNSGVISVQGISGMQAVQMGLSVANCIQWSHYSNEYTTAQTSTNLVAASGSTKIYVGRLTISTGGTTAGLVTVYFGTGAYSAGTSKTVFRGNFAPSSSSYPCVVIGSGVAPFCISAASDALKITTSAAITVYVQVDYVQV